MSIFADSNTKYTVVINEDQRDLICRALAMVEGDERGSLEDLFNELLELERFFPNKLHDFSEWRSKEEYEGWVVYKSDSGYWPVNCPKDATKEQATEAYLKEAGLTEWSEDVELVDVYVVKKE